MSDINAAMANAEALQFDPNGKIGYLPPWSEAVAHELAVKEGISLSDEHWEVIHLLRNHYRLHGHSMTGTKLLRALEEPFWMRGGKKHLFQLFPGGPVNQGSRIAGVPAPPYSKDLSFGSVE